MFKTLPRSKRNFKCVVKNHKRGKVRNSFYEYREYRRLMIIAIHNVLSIDTSQNSETHCYICTCQSCRRACWRCRTSFITEGFNDTLFLFPRRYTHK